MDLIAKTEAPQPFRPFCKSCGWRKGGIDSWNGVACKCGFNEPPICRVEDQPPKAENPGARLRQNHRSEGSRSRARRR